MLKSTNISYFRIVGFKRIILLSITAGVGGEIIRNLFVFRASIESITPICGLIGYMLGHYWSNSSTRWKYFLGERVHMLFSMLLVALLYLQLGIVYRNISLASMLAGFFVGFVFYFCDPD